jgi:hypothetical protein
MGSTLVPAQRKVAKATPHSWCLHAYHSSFLDDMTICVFVAYKNKP